MKDTMQLTVVALSFFVCLALFSRLYFHRRRRRENPKDYAYFLHERFGPTLRLPPMERVRRGLPYIPQATIEAWIREFEKVGVSIDSFAQQGGTQSLTRKVVKNKLQVDFPFLKNEGLRQAMFLVDYMAWHDGYHPQKPNQSSQSTLRRG